MKKLVAALAFALAVASPSAASADPFVGFRIGFGLPFGTAAGSISQSDVLRHVVPLQLEAGAALGPVDLAAYGAYGFGTPPSDCSGCSVNDVRLGVEGMLRSPLGGGRDLWAGILLGWKETRLSHGGGDFTASGWEGGLQGGYDFTGPGFGMGPFLQLTIGQYDTIESGGSSTSSFDKKFHEILQVGFRGFFKL
jgi:hypothetical protein